MTHESGAVKIEVSYGLLAGKAYRMTEDGGEQPFQLIYPGGLTTEDKEKIFACNLGVSTSVTQHLCAVMLNKENNRLMTYQELALVAQEVELKGKQPRHDLNNIFSRLNTNLKKGEVNIGVYPFGYEPRQRPRLPRMRCQYGFFLMRPM